MGQIKNIKLHIVTDIKKSCRSTEQQKPLNSINGDEESNTHSNIGMLCMCSLRCANSSPSPSPSSNNQGSSNNSSSNNSSSDYSGSDHCITGHHRSTHDRSTGSTEAVRPEYDV